MCPDDTYQTQACTAVDSSPKFCSLCSKCGVGEYMQHACSQDSNTVCAPCKKKCPLFDSSNSITGVCSGASASDSVVCYNSTTPLAGITPPGEYVASSIMLVRAASASITTVVQSMDISASGDFIFRQYVQDIGATLHIDVEIYPVEDVNNVRFASFSTQSFSSVMLPSGRSTSSNKFPTTSSDIHPVVMDQVWWASGSNRLLFSTQRVVGWIGYCWIIPGYVDIGSCGTLASTPSYDDASFSAITANQGKYILFLLFRHFSTTFLRAILFFN